MKKTNYFLKRLSLFFIFIFSVVVNSNAETTDTIRTIAEFNNLQDGAKVVFKGKAMTTLHLNRDYTTTNGIFIQDTTGAIFLKHQYLNETAIYFQDSRSNLYKFNEGGTEVFSFSGTFRKATTTLPNLIEFTNAEITKVSGGTYGNSIPYLEVKKEDLLADPLRYENLALKLIADVTKEGTSFYSTSYLLKNATNQVSINLSQPIMGNGMPAAGTFYGMCIKYQNKYQYLIENRYCIEPTAFFSIGDLFNFVDDVNRSDIEKVEVEIVEPMLVNYVVNNGASSNYYVQATNNATPAATVGMSVLLSEQSDELQINGGDSIVGLKGRYSKYIEKDGLFYGSVFRVADDDKDNIKLLNSNNSISWKDVKVKNLFNSPTNYESQFVSLSIGTLLKHILTENGQEVERFVFVQYDDILKRDDSIFVKIHNGDLTPYVGKELAIMGIFDMSENVAGGHPTILLRDESDFIYDKEFESIGAMLGEGKPRSSQINYILKNPVLVTYIYYAKDTQGGNNNTYGMFIQDETGAILLKTSKQYTNIAVGDSIVGVVGKLQYNTDGHNGHCLISDEALTLDTINTNNQLIPKNVTLDQVVKYPMDYAAQLIKIDNLETTIDFGFNQGTPYETHLLYQNGATMVVYWDDMYEDMSVTGVVEYNLLGKGFTILPIEINNTSKAFDGTCSRIKDIKNLPAGTEFTYVGNATTTFTDFTFGILIQDYTGGILLKNSNLGDNGISKIKSGMLITNIKGKYQPASGNNLPAIEVSDVDIENISIIDENSSFECMVTDVNVINHFYGDYLVCEALSLRNPNVEETTDGYVIRFSYIISGSEKVVKLKAFAKGEVDFTKGELVGYARRINGNLVFIMIGEGTSDFPGDIHPTDVKSIVLDNDIFISANGELLAPHATSIAVYDINGRVVAKNEDSKINISALSSGVYVVYTIYADGSFQATKVIR